MKTKIATALKTEYANLGLSQKALDGVASILEKTITEESGIDAAIKEASVRDLLKVFQGEIDTHRTAKSVAERALADYKEKHPEGNGGEKPKSDDDLTEMLRKMSERMDAYDRDKQNEATKERLATTKAELKTLLKEMKCSNEYIAEKALDKLTELKDGETAASLAETYAGIYDSEYQRAFGKGVSPRSVASEPPAGYKKGEFGDFIKEMQRIGAIPQSNN